MGEEKRVSEFEKFMEKINTASATLADTAELMKSENYEERFIAEYYQLKIRFDSLNTMLIKMAAGTLDFTPKCTQGTLEDQLYYMNEYMKILRIRAEIEGIDLFMTSKNASVGTPIEEIEEPPKKEDPEQENPLREEENDELGGF